MLVVLVLNNSRPSISLRIVGVGLRSHAAIRSAVPVAWLAPSLCDIPRPQRTETLGRETH